MPNDRRHGRAQGPRARFAAAGLGLAFLAFLAPPALAQASAEAQPALVAPGAPVVLTYRVAAPLPVDAAIQERVTCTLQAPDGSTAPLCDQPGALARVDVAPGEATYTFHVAAPQAPGTYTVLFTRARLLDPLGPADPSASTTFLVAAAEEPLAPGGGPGPDDGTDGGGTGGAGPADADGSDAERWLVSTAMGTAALVAMLVASRWGLGGAP